MIEKSLFTEKKLSLLLEQKALEDEQSADTKPHLASKVDNILELLKNVPLSYEMGNAADRRDLLKEITSNISLDRKNIAIKLRSPFQEIGDLATVASSGLDRDTPRTRVKAVFGILLAL
jgi:hypothetical protein